LQQLLVKEVQGTENFQGTKSYSSFKTRIPYKNFSISNLQYFLSENERNVESTVAVTIVLEYYREQMTALIQEDLIGERR